MTTGGWFLCRERPRSRAGLLLDYIRHRLWDCFQHDPVMNNNTSISALLVLVLVVL
jgi:hypothetical protein